MSRSVWRAVSSRSDADVFCSNVESGILVFNIVSGQLASKGARLEVLFDDGYWPSCTCTRLNVIAPRIRLRAPRKLSLFPNLQTLPR